MNSKPLIQIAEFMPTLTFTTFQIFVSNMLSAGANSTLHYDASAGAVKDHDLVVITGQCDPCQVCDLHSEAAPDDGILSFNARCISRTS